MVYSHYQCLAIASYMHQVGTLINESWIYPARNMWNTIDVQQERICVDLSFALCQPSSLSCCDLNRHRRKKQVSELQCFLSAVHPDSPLDSGTMCEVHLKAR